MRDYIALGVSEEKLYCVGTFGVDLEKFHPGLSGTEFRKELGLLESVPVIGQAGRMVPKKRFDFMLEAARLVIDAVPETVFLVVGDGPERANLERLARALDIQKNVLFTGLRLDMPKVVASFDIALFTMVDTIGGTANWEAMACAKPIVSTNNPLIEDGVTGFVVPSDNILEFANAIITLIRNPELRKKMGRKARQVSEERYDFAKMVIPKLQELYEEIARF